MLVCSEVTVAKQFVLIVMFMNLYCCVENDVQRDI